MPEGQDQQEKTEKATPKKRSEARKKGDVAKSREVSSVAVLLAGLST
ncbi:MAG: EscU/YscU/HrcU family type III secretion system export apparatus switch protein, partial [Deltaproteobacteria bacterium]|nr:EscU/YscU/HrcU family type III secretion system export apparatus switch protein [Deltaproteobacteria bacterium]